MALSTLLLDPAFIKGGIRTVHFLGLALGLGTATFLDLLMLRFMVRGKVRRTHAQAFAFGTKVVTAGLVMLWISGLGFLAYYGAFEAEKLANPKIWAKLTIVGVLTVNAIYLHAIVLPVVQRQVSRPLFQDLDTRQSMLMILGGTTSAVSWYVPVALATIPQFNFSLPANQIWALYCALLLTANALALLLFFGIIALRQVRPTASAQSAMRLQAPSLNAAGELAVS